MVSRSSSLNSKQSVDVLVVSGAQQSPCDRISRFPSPGQLSSKGGLSRTTSLKEQSCISCRSSLATLQETPNVAHPGGSPRLPPPQAMVTALSGRQSLRHSSSRDRVRPSDHYPEGPHLLLDAFSKSTSDPLQVIGKTRSKSLPPPEMPAPGQYPSKNSDDGDLTTPETLVLSRSNVPSRLPALPRSTPRTPRLTYVSSSHPPKLTLKRLSSLDWFMSYQEEKKLAALASSDVREFPRKIAEKSSIAVERELDPMPESPSEQNKFRHFAAEVGFCFTVAMTQLLTEYLIAGFAIVLPNIYQVDSSEGAGTTGHFWPAALLSLILSAFLLTFARVSDMYGGYFPFMFGLIWLAIWTLIPGFVSSSLLLNVSRANQGLAIAAFTPSTFSLVGSIYPEGPRRNLVLGLYGACAPLGFFAGLLAGGALPADESRWYFWIASALAFVTTITAYLSVPQDRTDRKRLNLKMDWLGTYMITSGLLLVTYALSVQPYANVDDPTRNGFEFPIVYAPLSSGVVCLAVAFWVEGWFASCPLLPFEFFRPQGVKPFSIACLFFYGSFGVWLYNSAE
jgi:MFS family permease